MDRLLEDIKTLETQNKETANADLANNLAKLRSDLRFMLIEQYHKHINSLKLTHYSSGNRAGKFLAQRLKERKSQTKIPYLIRATHKSKMFHPKDIADSFAEYYSSLYNLKDDPSTPQPSDEAIQTFLADIKLPSLSQTQLLTLNAPIIETEIQKAIKTLPCGKSPGPDGLTND